MTANNITTRTMKAIMMTGIMNRGGPIPVTARGRSYRSTRNAAMPV